VPHQPKFPGKLIAFEGGEGGGKSTQIQRLAARLKTLGREVLASREPGGTPIGEQIRSILVHNAAGDEMCPEAEFLLFAASRAQHVREKIAPALARGVTVLCDRYMDSSAVYQGFARNLPADTVNSINRFAVANALPDFTLIMDVPVAVGLARVASRATPLPDRMERQTAAFFQKVRDGYLRLARERPRNTLVLDATLPADTLERQIWDALAPLLAP
jgi:dTMP kinase